MDLLKRVIRRSWSNDFQENLLGNISVIVCPTGADEMTYKYLWLSVFKVAVILFTEGCSCSMCACAKGL